MKLFLAVAVLVSMLAAVSASMFGANNALNKRFPGSTPITVNEYQYLIKQQQQAQRPQPPRPDPNWMFAPNTQSLRTPVSRFPQGSYYPHGERPQDSRRRVPSPISVRADSDEMNLSREDD